MPRRKMAGRPTDILVSVVSSMDRVVIGLRKVKSWVRCDWTEESRTLPGCGYSLGEDSQKPLPDNKIP